MVIGQDIALVVYEESCSETVGCRAAGRFVGSVFAFRSSVRELAGVFKQKPFGCLNRMGIRVVEPAYCDGSFPAGLCIRTFITFSVRIAEEYPARCAIWVNGDATLQNGNRVVILPLAD